MVWEGRNVVSVGRAMIGEFGCQCAWTGTGSSIAAPIRSAETQQRQAVGIWLEFVSKQPLACTPRKGTLAQSHPVSRRPCHCSPLSNAALPSGATRPHESAPGTIRGDFAIEVGRNVIHGSDTVENGQKEIALWFPEVRRTGTGGCGGQGQGVAGGAGSR